MSSADPQAADSADQRVAFARRAVGANPVWYHSIELAPGVVTPGQVDMRSVADRLLPSDLGGLRALDVGTFDGFWAFELERRGADVIAIDVDSVESAEWPPLNRARLEARARDWDMELGRGFRLAAEAIGSNARRVPCNVYDLSTEVTSGPVDFAFAGAIMLHLRDPVRALERILAALAPGGRLVQLEPFSVVDTIRSPRTPVAQFQPLRSEFNWWYPNLATLLGWPRAAGFAEVRRAGFYRPPASRTMTAWHSGVASRRQPDAPGAR